MFMGTKREENALILSPFKNRKEKRQFLFGHCTMDFQLKTKKIDKCASKRCVIVELFVYLLASFLCHLKILFWTQQRTLSASKCRLFSQSQNTKIWTVHSVFFLSLSWHRNELYERPLTHQRRLMLNRKVILHCHCARIKTGNCMPPPFWHLCDNSLFATHREPVPKRGTHTSTTQCTTIHQISKIHVRKCVYATKPKLESTWNRKNS